MRPGLRLLLGSALLLAAAARAGGPAPDPGAVAGVVFDDANADGVFDGGDAGASGVTVWLDADSDGTRDADEPSAVSGAGGAFRVGGVPSATYLLRADPPPGATVTHPPLAPAGAGTLALLDEVLDGDGNVQLPGVVTVTVSPDDVHVYAGGSNGPIALFVRDLAADEETFDPFGTVDVGAADLAPSPDGKHLYAVGEPDALTVLARDAATGHLTPIQTFQNPGVPANDAIAGAIPLSGLRMSVQFESSVVVSPDGALVYTTSRVDDTVLVFRRDAATGLLSLLQTLQDNSVPVDDRIPGASIVEALDGALDAAPSGDGAHLYVVATDEPAAQTNAGSLTVLARDPVTDLHTQVDAVKTGAFTQVGVTVSPDGATVYLAARRSGNSGEVRVFARDAQSGLLAPVQTLQDGMDGVEGLAGVYRVAVSPDGANAYAASLSDGALAVFARDTTPGATLGTLAFLEVFQDDDPFAGFEIPGATVVDGLSFTQAAVVSPDGRRVYAVGGSDRAVVAFARDAADGTLGGAVTFKNGQGGGNGLHLPRRLLVSPDGRHAYAFTFDDAILVLHRDPATGLLDFGQVLQDDTSSDPIPFAETTDGLAGLDDAVMDPAGRFVYTVASRDDALAAFRRDGTSGDLEQVQVIQDDPASIPGAVSVAGLDAVTRVAMSPDGRDVYTVSTVAGTVIAFRCDPATGQLAFVQRLEDGFAGPGVQAAPAGLVFAPDGRHAYVESNGAGLASHLGRFARDPATGALAFVDVVSPPPAHASFVGSAALAFGPSGAFAYVLESLGVPPLSRYRHDAATGALAFEQALPDPGGLPVFSPDGRFAFAPDTVGLDRFTHDAASGDLVRLGAVADTADAGGLVFSPGAANAYMLLSEGFRVFAHDGGAAPPGTYRVFVAPGATAAGRDFGLAGLPRPTTTSTTTTTTTASTPATVTTTTVPVEVCGNCADDDGNGFVDWADPACCAAGDGMRLAAARVERPRRRRRSLLRLRALLDARFAGVDPRRDEVTLQLRSADGEGLLCATLGAADWRRRGKRFRFRGGGGAAALRATLVRLRKGRLRLEVDAPGVDPDRFDGDALAGTVRVGERCAADTVTARRRTRRRIVFR